MYYPPDIENLRNRKDEKYVSIRDIVESSHFDSNEYRIPFALGMENGEPRVLDVSRASVIYICFGNFLLMFIMPTITTFSAGHVGLATLCVVESYSTITCILQYFCG